MEQDVFAVLEKEGWSVPLSIPTMCTPPGKHILAGFSTALCTFDYKTVKLESSWLVFHVNSDAILAIQAAGILLCLIQVPTGSRQESTTRRGVNRKLEAELYGAWCKFFCLYQERHCVGTLLKPQSLQSLHHHLRASLHLIYALRLCFAFDTHSASTTQEKWPFFFVFC